MEPNPYFWASLIRRPRPVSKESAEGFLRWRGPWASEGPRPDPKSDRTAPRK